MSLDGLSLTILAPAFLADLLVVATHVPLGQQVPARGIVFIDLAIAQIAGLGVIAAHAFGWEAQSAAVGAALLGALPLTWTDANGDRLGPARGSVSGVRHPHRPGTGDPQCPRSMAASLRLPRRSCRLCRRGHAQSDL